MRTNYQAQSDRDTSLQLCCKHMRRVINEMSCYSYYKKLCY